MHVIPLYSTNREFSRVKLSQTHKQADIHNLHPHKRSVMPEVTLQNHSHAEQHTQNVFPLAPLYCRADASEAPRIIRKAECVNESMKERSANEVTARHPKRWALIGWEIVKLQMGCESHA